MRLCIPVERNDGLDSPVYGHFGSAPAFVVVDSETRDVRMIANEDLHHAHGACNPLKALGGEKIDAVVVGGIGAGALRGLNRAGLKVYRAVGRTVADNLASMAQDMPPELTAEQVCDGHQHGHGCGH